VKRLPTLIATALAAIALNATPAVANSLSEDNAVVPTAAGAPHAQVLMESRAGSGRAIEAFGDIRHADHIVVLVPGVGWNGPSLLDELDATRRHPAVQAREILAQAQELDPTARVAVVVWLDYDPPSTLDLDAAESTRAIAGAPRLARFVNGLPARADVSVVCHSYGAVVCGHAAHRLRARDIVALGAPGMDVNTVQQLHTGARVWAGTAEGDPISLVPHAQIGDLGHDADPTDASFGAHRLPTGGARGHNGYFTPGTTSLLNVARIALGRVDEVRDPGA
jgi:hypothetical protein